MTMQILSVFYKEKNTVSKDDVTNTKPPTYLSNVDFSASLLRAKLSRPKQTLTSRLVAKKPVSAIPMSRKCFGVMRALGLGFRSFLKCGNKDVGIEPLDDG